MKCHFPKSSLCYLYYMSSIVYYMSSILPAGDFEPMGTIIKQVQYKQKVGNPQNLQRRQVLSQKPNEQHLFLLRVKIFHSVPPMSFELCYHNGHGLVKKLLMEPSQRDGGVFSLQIPSTCTLGLNPCHTCQTFISAAITSTTFNYSLIINFSC